jgi:hypothetical protein
MRPDQIETLEAWANNWDEGPKALTLALIADWRKRGEALDQAEAVLSIVEPRSNKAEYLRVLGVVRDVLFSPP